ncbi:phage minor structural protein [Paenibacillus sp. LBL]|uniref:phage tail spike protein n=1 Tax=Paenibacillus sp. LBL TaxID=2940563 RepID=UPI0024741835|nr:phage tail spike protein [Paenibacillus sp. LBL]MDH6674230.1 phage minor structural protein [Paenibacillus sp. LBL]
MLASMGIGNIDRNIKPMNHKIFLLKPNRSTIGKINEAYDVAYSAKLGGINELTFRMPYDVDINHVLETNINADLVKERYLLRLEIGNLKEIFIITKINDDMEDDSDFKTITAYSLAYMLKDKMVRDIKLESKNAREALTVALSNTVWSIDYIDSDFELKYRQFEVSSKSVLDFIVEIAETYTALVEYNTLNCKVSLKKPNLVGTNKGLIFSYGKYLQSLGKESNSDEMVTRLKVFGSEGMSIQRVNPTGQNYIEDFSYFMYPFEQDNNGNVISHSYYMSDALCQALIRYNALIRSKQDYFKTLLTEKDGLLKTLTTLTQELTELDRQRDVILDIKDVQQADGAFSIYNFLFYGGSMSKSMDLNNIRKYVVLAKVSDNSNINISVNGLNSGLQNNQWSLVQRLQLTTLASINVTGGTTFGTDVKIQINQVTDDEFRGWKEVLNPDGSYTKVNITDGEILNKYGLDNKEVQIANKKAEIDNINKQIKVKDDAINALKNEISVQANFTPAQIVELNEYVIEKEFSDENIIDDEDLFEEAQKKFDELRLPQMVIEIDVVNFLECLEEQWNWRKLNLGDIITIKYEKLNIKVHAKIIQIDYDFENGTIKLTIANIKDIQTDAEKLMKYLYDSISTSTVVDMNKYKWDGTKTDLGEIDRIINSLWDKTKNELDMAANETVVIDKRGITIYDPNDPNKFLRATHGILGITDDGGNTYKHAITYFGIIGERIYGKIITGERVVIGDPDGILEILGNKGKITDRNGREVMWFGLYDTTNGDKFGMKLENDTNQVIIDRDSGFKITKNDGYGNWIDMAWLGTDGVLHAQGIRIFQSEVDHLMGILTNGIIINPTDGIMISRSDGLVRTILNATSGISIERYNGMFWQKKFYADTNGYLWVEDLNAKRIRVVNDFNEELINTDTSYMNIGKFENIIVDGKLTPLEKLQVKSEWERIKTEYQMLLQQANNYAFTSRDSSQRISTSAYSEAYLRLNNYIVPYLVNMDITEAIDRQLFIQRFQEYYDEAIKIINAIADSIKYSSLQLGQFYNNVLIDAIDGITVTRSDDMQRTRLNATEGFVLQVKENGQWVNRFSVDYTGKLQVDNIEARRLLLKGNNGEILLDADEKVLRLDNFDMVIGTVAAENIISKTITANEGFIADLTVNRLKTLPNNTSGYLNYIDIYEKYAKWVTSEITGTAQSKNSAGQLLYWTDSTKTAATTDNTGIPVMGNTFKERIKMQVYFNNDGFDAYPVWQWGEGDTLGGAIGYIYKEQDRFTLKYLVSNSAKLRLVDLTDAGLDIKTENGKLTIEHGLGSKIEIENSGIIKLTHSSGSYIQIANDIKLSAVGNIHLN